MNIIESIRLAFGNIRSNKLRSVLTMLGIIIGISSVITITTIGTSIKETIANTFSSLGGTNMISAYVEEIPDEDGYYEGYQMSEGDYITYDDLMEYKKEFEDKVTVVSALQSIGGGEVSLNQNSTQVGVIGSMPNYLEMNKVKLLQGRDISQSDNDKQKATALVSDLFVKYVLKGEDPLGRRIDIQLNDGSVLKVYVVGVYNYDLRRFGGAGGKVSEKDIATPVFVPITYAMKVMSQTGSAPGFEFFDFLAANGVDAAKLAKETEQYFNEKLYSENEHIKLSCYDMESELSIINTVLDVVTIAISVIAAISLIVGGVGVMNIMLVSVIERTREIGIRKALGAKNGSIQLQFLMESVVICLVGGMIGILIGIVNGMLLGKVAGMLVTQMASNVGSLLAITIRPSINAIVISVIFSMLTGIIFGSYPARRAAKLSPIDALRYE